MHNSVFSNRARVTRAGRRCCAPNYNKKRKNNDKIRMTGRKNLTLCKAGQDMFDTIKLSDGKGLFIETLRITRMGKHERAAKRQAGRAGSITMMGVCHRLITGLSLRRCQVALVLIAGCGRSHGRRFRAVNQLARLVYPRGLAL